MSLADYLAKNYLTADGPSSDPSRPKKKRKKNHSSEPTAGLLIADDDADLSIANSTLDDDNDGPSMHAASGASRSAEFRKKKTSGWKSLGGAAPEIGHSTSENAGAEEADSILQAAAREQESRRLADEDGDAPTIVDDPNNDQPRMSGGARGGLQTAADTRAMEVARQAQDEAERKAMKKKKSKEPAPQEETVYRDATGRRIDVHLKRAEARKAEEAARKKEIEEKKKMGGDIQNAEREQRKQDLDEAKFLQIARYADDDDLNSELKTRERWGDTMATYIEKKPAGKSNVDTKPVYKGSSQPNRYGIRPGHRWDGVDRSNGFEKEWFQARGRKERNKNLDYQWQMDE